MAKLLLDECCPPSLAKALRAAGHDVFHVLESSPGHTDSALALRAGNEQRIIVTYDYDFGELAVRQQLGRFGVVLVACQRLLPKDRHDRVVSVLANPAISLAGKLTVVEDRRIRQRPIGA